MTTPDKQPLCYAASFDSHPGMVGRVEVRESPEGDDVVVCVDGQDVHLLHAYRDQWGVFLNIDEACVAQEDETRSFIDALIGALQEVKRRNEFGTLPATIEPIA